MNEEIKKAFDVLNSGASARSSALLELAKSMRDMGVLTLRVIPRDENISKAFDGAEIIHIDDKDSAVVITSK